MAFIAPRFPHAMIRVVGAPTEIAHLQHLVPGAKVYSTKYDYSTGERRYTKGWHEPNEANVYVSAPALKRTKQCLDHWNKDYTITYNMKGFKGEIPLGAEFDSVAEVGKHIVSEMNVQPEWKEWPTRYQFGVVGLVHQGWVNLLLNWKAGSGKTIGAILAVEQIEGPKLFVLPSKLRPGWREEIIKVTGEEPFVCMPNTKGVGPTALINYLKLCKAEGKHPRVVVGIEYLSYWAELLKNMKPKAIVFDEVDLIANEKMMESKFNQDGSVTFKAKRSEKNKRKIRSVSAMELRVLESVEVCLTLTATPIYEGVPTKFWPVANLTWPYVLGFGAYHFKGRFCGGKMGEYGLMFNKATNINELKRRSLHFMHRVSAEEALAGLPDLSYSLLYVKKENQPKDIRYNDKYTYIQALRNASKDPDLTSVQEIRIAYLCDLCREAVVDEAVSEALSGGRCLIMVERLEQARIWKKKIETRLKRRMNKGMKGVPSVHLMIGEGMTPEERYAERDAYNANPHGAVAIGTRHAIGQGMDGLQQSTLGIFQPAPNAAMQEQAFGRIHRKGRKVRSRIKLMFPEGTYMEQHISTLADGFEMFENFLQDEGFRDTINALRAQEATVEDAVESLLSCISF